MALDNNGQHKNQGAKHQKLVTVGNAEISHDGFHDQLKGWLSPEVYSTAWIALVPDGADLSRPAWPQALEYLRAHQLSDGGWGDPHVYYAHGNTLATMAAVLALSTWQTSSDDCARIKQGVQAVERYAGDLLQEQHESIGFEVLLPRLRDELIAVGVEIPAEKWFHLDAIAMEKIALIRSLQPDAARRYTWWFSMEMLPEKQLAKLDDSFLDVNGAIAASTAATAAYLRARRKAGHDSLRAAQYLARLLDAGQGGAPVGWPFDVFERIWMLDSFRRAGYNPRSQRIQAMARRVHQSWETDDPGLAFSDEFAINDGDDTLVGFTALNWSGMTPSEKPVLEFWDGDHFRSYLDERGASVSVNIHGLTALRTQPGFPHRDLAERLTQWLTDQIGHDVIFEDKWHLSPYYSAARAIPAFIDWEEGIARQCMSFLLERQRSDGGWGWFGYSTLEESAHCVIGLGQAFKSGLLSHREPLINAARFFEMNADREAKEALWIGKTLYRPEGIVSATVFGAQFILENIGLNLPALEQIRKPVWAWW